MLGSPKLVTIYQHLLSIALTHHAGRVLRTVGIIFAHNFSCFHMVNVLFYLSVAATLVFNLFI